MSPNEYQQFANRTAKRFNDPYMDLLHPTLGLNGEAGEFTDAVKKWAIYGKTLDKGNLIEELGDALWYIALACEVLGTDMETVMKHNIAKLQKRYPDRYTDEAAIARADKQGESV